MAEIEDLRAHVADRYGFRAKTVFSFEDDVTLLRDADGTGWVARTFPPSRPRTAVEGDAQILRWLEGCDYPAERVIGEDCVSDLGEETVLLTQWVRAVPRARRRQTIKDAGGIRRLGELLAMLNTLELDAEAVRRPGGAWHHMADGAPSAELAAAHAWLERAREDAGVRELRHFEAIEDTLDALDDCADLPEALVHPDFTLSNMVATEGPAVILVDWAGAGCGPRLWPLAFSLWAAGAQNLRRVDLLVEGYRRHIQLSDAELGRLDRVVPARMLIFGIWHLHHHNRSAAEIAAAAEQHTRQGAEIAERARAAFTA